MEVWLLPTELRPGALLAKGECREDAGCAERFPLRCRRDRLILGSHFCGPGVPHAFALTSLVRIARKRTGEVCPWLTCVGSFTSTGTNTASSDAPRLRRRRGATRGTGPHTPTSPTTR